MISLTDSACGKVLGINNNSVIFTGYQMLVSSNKLSQKKTI